MPLTPVEEALLLAAWYRGGRPEDHVFTSNSDQVVTLSLFYTGDISFEECVARFARPIRSLYDAGGKLTPEINDRYRALIVLIRTHAELIIGGGDLRTPADPTFTACRLTPAGEDVACSLCSKFPEKPAFPSWPDRRSASRNESTAGTSEMPLT